MHPYLAIVGVAKNPIDSSSCNIDIALNSLCANTTRISITFPRDDSCCEDGGMTATAAAAPANDPNGARS
ncbi:hypothetical protein HNP11_001625 [Tsukamurella ocularis]|nr:hypothetical protein [Tsukamurella ocularis]MCS3787452.1 hypothetical protein [Tsukamurella ocularis]MCS3851611.1 hypothetical protein [Tsukamurella ocularis]